MGVRFNLVDEEGNRPEFDRAEHEVNPGIKLNSEGIHWILDNADRLGVDEERLRSTLGYKQDSSGWTYGVIIDGEKRRRLYEMLVEIRTAIEQQFDVDQIQTEHMALSDDDWPDRYEIVGEDRYGAYEAYIKTVGLIRSIEFARERGYKHRIG